MCTIYTFDKALYTAHKDAITRTIENDAWSNSHGASMLTIGTDESDSELVRTMSTDSLLASLDRLLGEGGTAERAWIHLRFSTTAFHGLNGCHGFAAGDYTVFHNGILKREESDNFHVDSELIANDIDAAGLEKAIERIGQYETYVNAMLVNNQTGAYTVVRMESGSLYTDGKGNYSSNKIVSAGITIAVKNNTRTDFEQTIVVPKPVVSRWERYQSALSFRSSFTGTGTGSYDNAGRWNATDWRDSGYEDDYLPIARRATSRDYSVLDVGTETLHMLYAIEECESAEEFTSVAEEYAWDKTGIPLSVYENLDVQQLQWFTRCGLWYADDEEVNKTLAESDQATLDEIEAYENATETELELDRAPVVLVRNSQKQGA